MNILPDPLSPHSTKDDLEKLGKEFLDYATTSFYGSRRRSMVANMAKMRNSYNGVINPNILTHINRQYGSELRAKYIDYRITRKKLDTICGEFLQRPLNSYVRITNKEAVMARVKKRNYLTAMMVGGQEVDRLRTMGFDPFNGIKKPESPEEVDEMVSKLGLKEEILMNMAVKDQMDRHRLKTKLLRNYKDLGLVGETHSRVYLDEFGKVIFQPIKPENKIFVEMEDDDFCDRTPIQGQRILMTKSEVYQLFEFTEVEKQQVTAAFDAGINSEFGIIEYEGRHCLEVFHMEFFLMDPYHRKVVVNPNTGERTVYDASSKWVKENEKKIKKDTDNGYYSIETRYKETLYEGYKLGKLQLYKKIRKVPNQIMKVDDPFPAFSTYVSLLFNTENNTRISFFQEMEEVKHLYNMARFQVNRELYKMKGTAITYNRAALSVDLKGNPQTVNQLLSNIINDGFLEYNSHKSGNYSQDNIDMHDALKVIDLGPSKSLPMLLQICYNIEALLDKVAGVNENRQGQTSASESVTNAQTNIQSSRTMTEPMNYMFDRYIEGIIMRICELSKVSWYLNPDQALKILGAEHVASLKQIQNLRMWDYAASVIDSRKEQELKERMFVYLDKAVMAGKLDPSVALKAEMKELLAEAQLVVEEAWEEMKQAEKDAATQQQEAAQKLADTQLQVAREDREDRQAHDMDMIAAKQGAKLDEKAMGDKNKALLSQQEHNQTKELTLNN